MDGDVCRKVVFYIVEILDGVDMDVPENLPVNCAAAARLPDDVTS